MSVKITKQSSIRNPQFTEDGSINLEFFVEDRNEWWPFTASVYDPEEYGPEIHEHVRKTMTVKPFVPPTIEEVRQETIAPRLFVVERMIADDPDNAQRTEELECWALENKIPESAREIFQALPLQDRAAAMRNEVLQRASPLIPPFAAVYGYKTPEAIDVLFAIGE